MSDETLFDFQSWFASIITRPFRQTDDLQLPVYDEITLREIEARVPETASLRPHQRVALYHQQYWWRLFILLQEHYPTLLRLFGYTDFNIKIAEPYFLEHPPTDWFLPNLTRALPAYLRESYHEEDRPLVLPIAEIDEAYERLLHAPIPKIFSMDADFFAFRSKLLAHAPEHWLENDFPELTASKCFFVLHRRFNGLEYLQISEAEYLLLLGHQLAMYA